MRLMSCIVATVIAMQSIYTQDFPTLNNANVSTVVSTVDAQPLITYSYSVFNPSNNSASIWIFRIDISTLSADEPVDTSGLVFGDEFTRTSVLRQYERLGSGLVAIGFPSRPSFWAAGITNKRQVDWGSGSRFIDPGDTQSGFVLQSKGLPAIRAFAVRGYFDIDQFPSLDDMPTLEAADSLVRVIDSLRAALTLVGQTVGPQLPPGPVAPLQFLDTLISYKHQAVTLGWLKDVLDDGQSIIKKLDTPLEKARDGLASGNVTKAKDELGIFLRLVEKLRKRSVEAENKGELGDVVMTSEAYALLKFNAEFLLSKL